MPVTTLAAEEGFARAGHPRNPAVMRATASEDQGRASTLSMDSTLANISHIPSIADEDDLPPPIPPKDPQKANFSSAFVHSKPMTLAYSSPPAPGYARRKEVPSELAYTTQSEAPYTPPRVLRSSPRVKSPEERARLRLEAQQRRKEEERRVREEEAQRQAMLKQQREEELRYEQEEEERRLARLEEEKRHALIERARREREMQLEEEQKEREAELRREQEKARRLEQARRFEEERQEIERRSAEVARKKEEQRQLSQSRRKERMREVREQFSKSRKGASDTIWLNGTITMQTSIALAWKRRYFELTEDAVLFYRDSLVKLLTHDVRKN